MRFLLLCLVSCSTIFCVMCKQPDKKSIPPVARYEIEKGTPRVYELAKPLKEISGIAFVPGGALLAHNDEDAAVFLLDPANGTITKTIALEHAGGKGDFEDIAVAGNRVFIVRSDGALFAFDYPVAGDVASCERYETGLTARHNVEGLCYDPATDALLLACKEWPGSGMKGMRAVYSFSMRDMALHSKPRFTLALNKITAHTSGGEFMPSGIAWNQHTGTFFVIAARGNAILELAADGRIISQSQLPVKLHRQPEGIAIHPDGALYIANEGANGKAVLTVYPLKGK